MILNPDDYIRVVDAKGLPVLWTETFEVPLCVGVDAGCGGIQGPLFEDGSFDFVCIPDNKG